MDIFEIYYSYLRGCAEVNDPDEEKGVWEWHHILPQCLFGDTPVGQWLTKEQHAIASVIQSEAFNTCCVTGMMKRHLPDEWLVTWLKWRRKAMSLAQSHISEETYRENGRKNIHHPNLAKTRYKKNYTDAQREAREAWGRDVHTPEKRREIGRLGGLAGKGNPGRRKDNGRQTNAQRWRCLETGKITTSGALTNYQRARGIDTSKRVRVQ